MAEPHELEGQVALVTGAGSGIGRAAALCLARSGAAVGLLSRTRRQLEEVARAIEEHGGQALVLEADTSRPAEVKDAIEQLAGTYARLDVVFANAGVNGTWAPIDELTPEEWQKTLQINLSGTFYTVKYAVPHLRRQGGSIIVCSSINGTRTFSNSGATAYAATKAGQVALTKMLAVELAKDRIRVNVVCPGAISTEIADNTEQRNAERARAPELPREPSVPLTHGQPGTPEQVADLVLYLASARSSLVSGTEIWIDGAQSLIT